MEPSPKGNFGLSPPIFSNIKLVENTIKKQDSAIMILFKFL